MILRPRTVLWFGLLSLMLSCDGEDPPSNRAEAPPTVLYVDGASTAAGTGTQSRPFQTISEALAVVASGMTIRVAPGNYPEQITITTSLTLTGEGPATEIAGTANPSVRVTSAATVEIRDIEVHGLEAEAGVILDLEAVVLSGETAPALLANSASITMNGGAVRDAAAGGIEIHSGDLELSSVVVEGCVGHGIFADEVERVVITGGTFRELIGIAVRLDDSSTEISDVTIEDISSADPGTDDGHGISVSGGDLELRDSDLYRLATRGLVVRGGLIDVSGCEFAGSGLTAVAAMPSLSGEPSRGEVRDSAFEGNGTDVFASGSDLDVVGNYFTGSQHPILTDTSALRIDRNVFDATTDSFISLLQPEQTLIRDNRGRDTDGACLFVTYSQSPLLIDNNTFQFCRGNAISVSDSTNVTITNNAIDDVRQDLAFEDIGDGITLIDSSVTVEGNRISRAVGTGIGALRVEGTIASNEIEETQVGGIQLTDCRASEVVVRENRLSSVAGPGIIVLNSLALVDSNEAIDGVLSLDGFGDGIAIVDHSEARVIGNTCEDNQRNGIVILSGVEASVERNYLRRNDQYGIRVYCEHEGITESTVLVVDNEFTENGLGQYSGCE